MRSGRSKDIPSAAQRPIMGIMPKIGDPPHSRSLALRGDHGHPFSPLHDYSRSWMMRRPVRATPPPVLRRATRFPLVADARSKGAIRMRNATRRIGLAVAVLGLVAGVVGQARAGVVLTFTGS